MKRIIITLTSLMLVALAFGQTNFNSNNGVKLDAGRLSPRLLNYQGFLTDTLGNPITNPSVSMIFGIWSLSSGGSQLWFESQIVSVNKGIFSVLLGGITLLPDSVFTKNTDRWLELTYSGITLSPRTRIVSAPYAVTSTYADTATYARNSTPENDWKFLVSDVADTTLQMGGRWGLARAGNVLYGNADSTHVNLGVACTTGTSGQNYKYCTAGGGISNKVGYDYATVGGGSYNRATGLAATIGGGYCDTVIAPYGGVFSGYNNIAGDIIGYDTGAVVLGGSNNSAIAMYSCVGGGQNNTANQHHATVGGGYNNIASRYYAIVGGGYNNSASFDYTTVGGGQNNTASYSHATVSGGNNNVADTFYATIGGGNGNDANGYAATISGGYLNTASNRYATVGGGCYNRAYGRNATIGGGYCDTVIAPYGGVLTGYSNNAGDSTIDTCAAVVGGYNNSAIAMYSFIGGGRNNTASMGYATVGGGRNNTASFNYTTVAGGTNNIADTVLATVGGGGNNIVSGYAATVSGGYYNVATNEYATICGGDGDTASGYASTVCGGRLNTCAGGYGFVANYSSYIDALYSTSAAFNAQAVTSSSQTRVGILSKAGGTFTIDHPLDPENKILNHYFVESPEMVLIYRGSANIRSNGKAVVHLPDYFNALNENPMIQLTGVKSNDVWVEEEVVNNSFTIGGKPGIKVFWTVTGARKDPSAEITKILMPVEQVKEGGLIGRSLDDDLLVSTMAQLERMGKASGFKFRHASGQKRYEEMKREIEAGEKK